MKRSSLLILLLFIEIQTLYAQGSNSWEAVKKSRKGTLTIFWFQNSPFGYMDKAGKMKGIEVEIIEGFQQYIEKQHAIDLSLRWVQEKTFNGVLTRMKESSLPGTFGIAGFSFSEERKKFMNFSPSYMADIAVLVSTPDIPIVRTPNDLKKYFDGSTALTAQGTVIENELIQIRDEYNIQFKIEYTGASEELIGVLNQRKKSFGYLSLPVYLMNLDKGASKLNRQNYLSKRYEGRGIGMPIASDWNEPLNEYFASQEFKQRIETIIAGYVNIDLYHFIETFNPENEISLLNKEKDIQQMNLVLQELEIRDKNQKQVYLIIIISVFIILLIIIIILFKKQVHNHHLLNKQKAEIEAQSDQIRLINKNLEEIVKERTSELKNKNIALEEYAFITAHKLRAPLASILGLINLINKMNISKEDKIVVGHLTQSAKKLDDIIHSIMDAIDTSDVPKEY